VVSAGLAIRTLPLGAQVAQRLRAMILRRDLQDGMRLLEEDLATQFDVSRGPIRDALKQLEREGVVTMRKKAACVAALSSKDIRDLYELRKALEDYLHNSAEDHHTLLEMIRSSDHRVVGEVSDHIDRARDRMIKRYERQSTTKTVFKES